MIKTTCFNLFEQCVLAVQSGELIESISSKDKEFHFQNWFQNVSNNSICILKVPDAILILIFV